VANLTDQFTKKVKEFSFYCLAEDESAGCTDAAQVLVLQPLRWCCAECAVHHERNMHEEQHHIYVARTSNNRVISSGDPYCCLLPQCEALRICRSGFPIATVGGINDGFNLTEELAGMQVIERLNNWKRFMQQDS